MMINHIVSSSIVIVFVLLIGTIFETKISACLKYSLWLLVAVKLFIPLPGVESEFHVMNFIKFYAEVISNSLENDSEDNLLYEQSVIVDNNINSETNQSVVHNIGDEARTEIKREQMSETVTEDKNGNKANGRMVLSMIVKVVYFTGVITCFATILLSNIHFYKAFKDKRIYIKTYNDKIRVYKVEDYYGACLYGGFLPVIIVGNNTNLSMEQQDMIMQHEYIHYIHGDHIWAMIRNLCVALYWYHPLVWMAASISRKDGELACDEGIIRRIEKTKRIIYGQTLLEVLSKASEKNDIISAVFLNSTTATRSKEEMRKRISMIAKRKKTSKAALVLVVILSIGCIGCTWGNPTMNTDSKETTQAEIDLEVEKTEEISDIAEYDHIEPDEYGYRWLSDEVYIYELEDLDQNGIEEYVKVWLAEKEPSYFCRFTFYWNHEPIYEYDDPCRLFPGNAEYLDLDGDGKKEVFFPFFPAVNSMPLVEYIVLKQKDDTSWEPLEMIYGEEMWQNAFPISVTKGKNEWEAIISCENLEKKVYFDLSHYHSQLLKMREKANPEEKETLLSLINDYKYGFPETSEWYTFGSVCAWGIWNIQSGKYQGTPCLIATHGIQGYDKFDFWGELDVYFNYDAQGKTRFLDIEFRNSENWEVAERKEKEVNINVEKKGFVWPTVSTTISVNFGERVHPITGEKKKIDYLGIEGNQGESVYAVADGDIIDVGFDNTLGNYIILATLTGEEVIYGHLDGSKVPIGAQVKSGDIIGLMGKTGTATGTFLSISIKVNGEMVDPMLYLETGMQSETIIYNGKEYMKSELCNDTLRWLKLSEQERELSSYFPPEFMIFDETWGVSLSVENVTPTSATIKCIQSGGEPSGELHTGSWYILEIWTKEKGWIEMPYVIDGEIGWNDIAWIIPMEDTVELEVNWEWLYGKLPIGKYRIGKSITDFRDTDDYDTATYYVEFEIKK